MFKKIMLCAAVAVSSLAIAQINLDLNLSISYEENQQQATGSVIVNENEVTSIVFNGLESLIIDMAVAQTENDNVIIQAQFSQKMENDELMPIADALAVEAQLGQAATFTINAADESGALVLVVVPSVVE